MFNLYHICLLRAFDNIYMEFARYKCLLLCLLLSLNKKYHCPLTFPGESGRVLCDGRATVTQCFTIYQVLPLHVSVCTHEGSG